MATEIKPLIKIIMGSTRPGRFTVQPSHWLFELAKKRDDMQVELVDLETINLPLLDEPVPASAGEYTKEHTKQWSNVIDEADGFVFVVAEYNHGVTGALKNAIDYLYKEWNYKPVSFISYGNPAGGARAVEQLRAIAGELKMFDLREQLLFNSYYEQMNDKGEYQFTERQEKTAQHILDEIVYWTKALNEPRRILLESK